MSLKDRIAADMKAALKAREADRLGAIRLLMAAIKQMEIDERVVAEDPAILAIVDKLLKQRRDSVTQFEAAGRVDLAARESAEIAVLTSYLPRALSTDEIDTEIAAAMAAVASAGGAPGQAAIGRIMAILKPRLAGRADMAQVAGRVKESLAR